MLKIQRDPHFLVFLFEEPIDTSVFEELKATLRDFIKIGKTSFCWDFTAIKEVSTEIGAQFDSITPILQAKQCTLELRGISEKVLNQLPKTKFFVTHHQKNTAKKHRFSMDVTPSTNKGEAILQLSGDFMEIDDLEDFKTKALQLLQNHDQLVLGCNSLSHISTIAVGGFIFLKVHCDNTKKSISIAGVSDGIRYTLEMTGILHIIPVR